MKSSDIWSLFNGVAVIIDDGIKDAKYDLVNDPINKIVEELKGKNVVCATYSEIPNEEVVKSMRNISFLIIDWNFDKPLTDVSIGSELQTDNENRVMSFIGKFLDCTFAPVFLFTNEDTDNIKKRLEDRLAGKINRIFLCKKSELSGIEMIEKRIFEWIQGKPSIYVFKEWNRVITEAKNTFFTDMYSYSSNWANIISRRLKEDGKDHHKDFGDFLTKQLLYRANNFEFDPNIMGTNDGNSEREDIMKVLEGERYVVYDEDRLPKQFYLGDLFYCKSEDEYYLNIRAQCDLSRKQKCELYFVKGKEYDIDEIRSSSIKVNFVDKYAEFDIGGKICTYKYLPMEEDTAEKKSTEVSKKELEDRLNGLFDKPRFHLGSILSRKTEYFLVCVNGGKCIKFNLNSFFVKELDAGNAADDEACKRIGRVLPPYVYEIQQKCIAYMTRVGTIPLPDEIFN